MARVVRTPPFLHSPLAQDGAALLSAAFAGNLNEVKRLVEVVKVPLDWYWDLSGDTPLHKAAEGGRLYVVNWLIIGAFPRADVEAKNGFGYTAMHIAAGRGDLRMVKELVKARGASLDAEDNEKQTPLHHAAKLGQDLMVKCLVQQPMNADTNARDNAGLTPLHHAASNDHLGIVEWLTTPLNQNGGGADLVPLDKIDATPLHHAAGHIQVASYLVGRGVPIDQKDKFGRTALAMATLAKNTETAKLFLKSGADLGEMHKQLMRDLLRLMDLSPSVLPDQFKGAVTAMSVVAVLLVTVTYIGWLNPPGGANSDGFVKVFTSASAAASGMIGGDYINAGLLRAFLIVNALSFYMAVATVILTAIVFVPVKTRGFFEEAQLNKSRLYLITFGLTASIVLATLAFALAGVAVLPPHYRSDSIATAAVGGVLLLGVVGSFCMYLT